MSPLIAVFVLFVIRALYISIWMISREGRPGVDDRLFAAERLKMKSVTVSRTVNHSVTSVLIPKCPVEIRYCGGSEKTASRLHILRQACTKSAAAKIVDSLRACRCNGRKNRVKWAHRTAGLIRQYSGACRRAVSINTHRQPSPARVRDSCDEKGGRTAGNKAVTKLYLRRDDRQSELVCKGG